MNSDDNGLKLRFSPIDPILVFIVGFIVIFENFRLGPVHKLDYVMFPSVFVAMYLVLRQIARSSFYSADARTLQYHFKKLNQEVTKLLCHYDEISFVKKQHLHFFLIYGTLIVLKNGKKIFLSNQLENKDKLIELLQSKEIELR